MNVVLLVGSIVGNKTRTALLAMESMLKEQRPDMKIKVVDLAGKDIVFSDGRPYFEYTGDTLDIASALMEADGIIIGTPTFQASIPGVLKNVFDLLPIYAFRDKVVGVITTAGTPKHYLMVEHQLKPILSYMKAIHLTNYVFLEEQDVDQGAIVNDDIKTRLDRLAKEFSQTLDSRRFIQETINNSFDF